MGSADKLLINLCVTTSDPFYSISHIVISFIVNKQDFVKQNKKKKCAKKICMVSYYILYCAL